MIMASSMSYPGPANRRSLIKHEVFMQAAARDLQKNFSLSCVRDHCNNGVCSNGMLVTVHPVVPFPAHRVRMHTLVAGIALSPQSDSSVPRCISVLTSGLWGHHTRKTLLSGRKSWLWYGVAIVCLSIWHWYLLSTPASSQKGSCFDRELRRAACFSGFGCGWKTA